THTLASPQPDGSKGLVMSAENQRARPQAVRLVLRHYAAQMRADRFIAVPAMLLPAIGDVLVFYTPPLVIAHVLALVARGQNATPGRLAPFIGLFGVIWLSGEILWRIGGVYINKF